MGIRFCALSIVMAGLALAAGCDPSPTATTPATSRASTTTGTDASAAVSETMTPLPNNVASEKRNRISLIVLPFSIEVPASWLVQSGAANRVILHGNSPSGEIEILLGTQPAVKANMLPLLLKEIAKPSSNPLVKNVVSQHDGITIVEQIEPQAVGHQEPDLVPMRWTMQYMIADSGPDYSVYELNVIGLSQTMFEHDQAFIQGIFDSVRHDSSATRPVGVP